MMNEEEKELHVEGPLMVDLSARRLEQEVDALICAALKVGVGGKVVVAPSRDMEEREFRVDRIIVDDSGYPSEVWFSAPGKLSLWDRIKGRRTRDLLRVSRVGGDVRRSLTTIALGNSNVLHLGFREEVGAPRISRSVATFRYPRGDTADWLHEHFRAS